MATAPKTNPDVGKPASVTPPTPARATSKTKIAGSALVPSKRSVTGRVRQYRYWVGVTPSCPVEAIDLAGINFPKVNENIVDDPLRTGEKRRVPVIGSIVFLTEDKIRRMRERLPRTVIRFLDDKGQRDEPGTGENVGDNHVRPRRGQLITIPSAEEIQARRAANRPAREYVEHPNDVPAARFMFAVLCEDQERGSRGDYYPDVLENTGLEWPDEIEDELLS